MGAHTYASCNIKDNNLSHSHPLTSFIGFLLYGVTITIIIIIVIVVVVIVVGVNGVIITLLSITIIID